MTRAATPVHRSGLLNILIESQARTRAALLEQDEVERRQQEAMQGTSMSQVSTFNRQSWEPGDIQPHRSVAPRVRSWRRKVGPGGSR